MALGAYGPNLRLIAFATGVIVPRQVLSALSGPAYNIHPGPSTRPGLYPSCHAIYDGDRRFGSTLHEITPRVDEGPIIGVDEFDVPPGVDRMTLETMAFQSVLRLVERFASALTGPTAELTTHLPRLDVQWSGRKSTRRDFDALCTLPQHVDEAEFQRRYRAVGEGPEHALTLTLFGHRFRLDNPRAEATVYVAGNPARES